MARLEYEIALLVASAEGNIMVQFLEAKCFGTANIPGDCLSSFCILKILYTTQNRILLLRNSCLNCAEHLLG